MRTAHIVALSRSSSDDILGVGVTTDDVFPRQRTWSAFVPHMYCRHLSKSVGLVETGPAAVRPVCTCDGVFLSGKGLLQLLVSIIIIT